MTILEAGIIAGGPVGAAVGGVLGRSHGAFAAVGLGAGGLVAGAAAGWVFAVLLICLVSGIGVLWRAVGKRPADAAGEAEMKVMSRVAVRGTFVSAAAGALGLMGWNWMVALGVLMMAACITALVAVARCEFGRGE